MKIRLRILILVQLTLLAPLLGCTSTLYFGSPHSIERIHLTSSKPDQYSLYVDAPGGSHYQVPADGRLVIEFPEVPKECRGRLPNMFYGGRKPGPARLEVRKGKRVIRVLYFREVEALPIDNEGYRLIEIKS